MALGIEWSVSESGFPEFDAWAAHALNTSGDMRDPLTDARNYVQSMIYEEFLTDGARSGGWEPLDHKYDMWKIGHGQFTIMELDVELLHGDPGTPRDEQMKDVLLGDESWTITDTDALFAPDSTRAAWHQAGAPIRRKGSRLPQRPVLVFLPEDYDAIEEYFADWMENEVF